MDYATIRTAIVSELHSYLGYPVVMLEQAKKKPDYPFLGYKFTVTNNPEPGIPAEPWEAVLSDDPAFDFDVQYTRQTMPTLTLSITVYAEDIDQVIDLAKKVHDWFYFHGYQYLKNNGIVVTSQTSIQDRATLILGDYEQRQGFDIVLRVTDEAKRKEITIESAEIMRK